MNETLLALLGFATIIAIIVLLLRNVTVPALAFIGVGADIIRPRYTKGVQLTCGRILSAPTLVFIRFRS